uniref:Putative secreted protein n=1 Tax=Ixodes ricinus TaxID=34613 RepID=A0A6B0TYQ5_IXORI
MQHLHGIRLASLACCIHCSPSSSGETNYRSTAQILREQVCAFTHTLTCFFSWAIVAELVKSSCASDGQICAPIIFNTLVIK